ncbi:hypothetical protein [Limnobacter sp.]|uniref:hypothetical protein n=1 Tax=Limnobacter sp. TaxID=2003368 RepID=UPI0025B7CDA8|nr:hypothetical protein [Limnobacter sp.]
MARADYSIANQSGANFRSELNDTLAAIQSVNSGSGTPTDTVAFQLFVDTNDSNNLKARNAANNGNVTLGPITTTNFGLAPLSGATFTGDVVLNTTTALRLPVGTTAQRSGSAANGDIRYNSTTSSFEGYAGGAWGSIGGGATGGGSDSVFYENSLTVTTSYTITANSGAHAVGPLTINSGATVTVPSTSHLVIS